MARATDSRAIAGLMIHRLALTHELLSEAKRVRVTWLMLYWPTVRMRRLSEMDPLKVEGLHSNVLIAMTLLLNSEI